MLATLFVTMKIQGYDNLAKENEHQFMSKNITKKSNN